MMSFSWCFLCSILCESYVLSASQIYISKSSGLASLEPRLSDNRSTLHCLLYTLSSMLQGVYSAVIFYTLHGKHYHILYMGPYLALYTTSSVPDTLSCCIWKLCTTCFILFSLLSVFVCLFCTLLYSILCSRHSTLRTLYLHSVLYTLQYPIFILCTL